jgi:hypothetical protein
MISKAPAAALRPPLGTWRLVSTTVLVCAAAVLLVGLFAAFGSEDLGWDARSAYLPAAESILDGDSPYPEPESDTLREERGYVYPPHIALLHVPLTVVPDDVAALLAVLVSLGSLIGALAVLGVRDARCYAAVLVSAPAWNVLEMANVSGLLVFAGALTWRYRDSAFRLGLVLGLAVGAKLFLWPLLVWTAATRRFRATATALVVGVVGIVVAWGVIGFEGLRGYPELLRALSSLQADNSYSLIGVAAGLGLDPTVGRIAAVAVGGVLLAATIKLGREGDDFSAFACTIAAALVLSPVLWLHYLAILFVPLAISRPRFSALWLLPTVLWLCPRAGNGELLQTVLPVLVVLALTWAVVAGPHPGRRLREAWA